MGRGICIQGVWLGWLGLEDSDTAFCFVLFRLCIFCVVFVLYYKFDMSCLSNRFGLQSLSCALSVYICTLHKRSIAVT